jgi:hypothetical protein
MQVCLPAGGGLRRQALWYRAKHWRRNLLGHRWRTCSYPLHICRRKLLARVHSVSVAMACAGTGTRRDVQIRRSAEYQLIDFRRNPASGILSVTRLGCASRLPGISLMWSVSSAGKRSRGAAMADVQGGLPSAAPRNCATQPGAMIRRPWKRFARGVGRHSGSRTDTRWQAGSTWRRRLLNSRRCLRASTHPPG